MTFMMPTVLLLAILMTSLMPIVLLFAVLMTSLMPIVLLFTVLLTSPIPTVLLFTALVISVLPNVPSSTAPVTSLTPIVLALPLTPLMPIGLAIYGAYGVPDADSFAIQSAVDFLGGAYVCPPDAEFKDGTGICENCGMSRTKTRFLQVQARRGNRTHAEAVSVVPAPSL